MNIAAEKIALIQQILQVEDETAFARLRDAVRQLLGSKPTLPPLPDEEVARQLREARQQAATEEVLSVEEVTALTQQWRTT